MSKKRAGIITASVLAAGLAIGGVTTGVVLANRPLSVTYYANNGTPAVTTQVNKNETLNLPTPTREGYNFAGWYTDVGLTNQVTKSTKLKNNSKLYAGWELANYETAASGEDEAAPLAETNGLKSIGKYAFANSKISRVSLPNTVTSIDEGAFSNCANLTEVTIPSSVKTIGERAFINCINLTSLTINYPVTTIGANAFTCCKKLSSVTFNATVTNINEGAFAFCDSLTNITFSVAATNIGNYAFAQTHATTIKVPSLATWCSMGFASADANPLTAGATLKVNGSVLNLTGTLEIPSSVTKIGSYAFANCAGLTEILIPSSVTTIGANAFGGVANSVKIHTTLETKPSGWNDNWNNYDSANKLTTKWCSLKLVGWNKIKEISQAGKAASKFAVGDEKQVTLTDGTVMTMQIADFNHDVDENGNTIGITFVTKDLLPNSFNSYMNSVVASNAGGWKDCDMRTKLYGPICRGKLPSELQDVITAAKKKSLAGGYEPMSLNINETVDELFLLSVAELNEQTTEDGYKNEGTPYAIFSDAASRIKKYADTGSAGDWWTRSTYNVYGGTYGAVMSSGVIYGGIYPCNQVLGICFGFCV